MLQYTYNDRNIGSAYIYAESLKAAPASSDHVAGDDASTGLEGTEPAESEPAGDGSNKEADSPSGQTGKGISWIAALAVFLVLGLIAGGALLIQYQRRKEREALARRKERRRQRLLESGVSEEEFAALLAERTRHKDTAGKNRQPQK